jgi:hypothetical protein
MKGPAHISRFIQIITHQKSAISLTSCEEQSQAPLFILDFESHQKNRLLFTITIITRTMQLSSLFYVALSLGATVSASPQNWDSWPIVTSCDTDIKDGNNFLQLIDAFNFSPIPVPDSEAECPAALATLTSVAEENGVANICPFPLDGAIGRTCVINFFGSS